MGFLKFLKIVLLIYGGWYGINLLLDIVKSKKSVSGGKKTVEIIPETAVGNDTTSADVFEPPTAPRKVGLDWDSEPDEHTRFMPQPATKAPAPNSETIEVADEIQQQTETIDLSETDIPENEAGEDDEYAAAEYSLQADLGLETVYETGVSTAQLEEQNMEDYGYAA